MNLLERIDDTVYSYATLRQKEYIDAVREFGTYIKAAEELGVNISTIHRSLSAAIKKAELKGYSPDHDMTKTVPDAFNVSGVSTMYGKDGEVIVQWVKSCQDREKQYELIKFLSENLAQENAKPIETIPAPANAIDDLMCVIPIGDAHIGMLAWAEETGADYDLSISESLHKQAINQLIKAAPMAESCVILDVGDFIHADNLVGQTSRSGHNLDMDGRMHKVIRVVMRIVQYYIERALEKFPRVIYRPEMGNHNDMGAIWLQESFSIIYANNPRVSVANQPGNRFYWQHGLCYFGSHHGHEIKIDKLPEVMATHLVDKGVKTQFRKWFTGHIHHQTKKDFGFCEVQSYRTLASLDAYAASHGYNAPRDISLEVWHKENGEVATHRVNVAMLKTKEEAA